MNCEKVKLGSILSESKVISENPDTNKRIKVRLKVLGVEKRGIENEVEGATKQFIRRAGQFIFGKQNFHKGAFGIVPDELDGFESSSDLPAFDIDKSCLPEFLFYFFKQGNYYLELSKIAYGVATQRINMKEFFELEIPLPDIEIQKQIISQFKTLENGGLKISSELTHQLDLIKQMRQAFLREAMQGKLVKSTNTKETGQQLLTKIKAEKVKLIADKKLKKEKELSPISEDEIPFEIPEHWVWCRLGELRDFRYTLSYGVLVPGNDVIGGIPLIRVQDLDNSYLNVPPTKHISLSIEKKFAKTRLLGGEILICVVGSIGKVALTNSNWIGANIARAVCRLMPNNNINTKYFFNVLQSPFVQDFFQGEKKSVNPTLNINILETTLIPLPPLHEQEQIVTKLEELMAFCDGLEQSIKESQGYNEMLLQQVLREALQGGGSLKILLDGKY